MTSENVNEKFPAPENNEKAKAPSADPRGTFQNDPDDPSNPNEVRERFEEEIRERKRTNNEG